MASLYCSLVAFALLAYLPGRIQAGTYGTYTPGYTATYYSGQGIGSSCGYGPNAVSSGFGVQTASVSPVVYAGGAACGACMVVQCVGSPTCTKAVSTVVTVSNICPATSTGGVCAGAKKSITLQPAVWSRLNTNPKLGVISVKAARVQCSRVGGVTFKVVTGKPYYIAILISNIAGSGDLAAVAVSVGGSAYVKMTRSYGSVWQLSGVLVSGKPLSFKLKTGFVPALITIPNAIPASWQAGQSFKTKINFAGGRARLAMELQNSDLVLNATIGA